MTEEQEAAIIRRVFAAPYSHAEAVLARFNALARCLPHDAAVARLHDEIINQPTNERSVPLTNQRKAQHDEEGSHHHDPGPRAR